MQTPACVRGVIPNRKQGLREGGCAYRLAARALRRVRGRAPYTPSSMRSGHSTSSLMRRRKVTACAWAACMGGGGLCKRLAAQISPPPQVCRGRTAGPRSHAEGEGGHSRPLGPCTAAPPHTHTHTHSHTHTHLAAVDEAVVIGERHIHHGPRHPGAVDDHGPLRGAQVAKRTGRRVLWKGIRKRRAASACSSQVVSARAQGFAAGSAPARTCTMLCMPRMALCGGLMMGVPKRLP